ncbi:alpha-glucosidase isoform X1 [Patella vulgata]|uniref:alpha-glucosidase isoform X1 n=2 Tax=Patella vulgata TaxID=6465 RepID=UPI0024A86F2D|nr:alpha-glucosidase isoform X1 [Patella vulgata]
MSPKVEFSSKKTGCCATNKCLIFLFFVVALGITALIVVALLAMNVRGRFPPDQKWWQKTIVYQIYPRSFQDSDGDGVGDLNGIISRLDYFNYLGVNAIWISPIYESPMKDFGYDISNFTKVDPMFGSMENMKTLIKEAHARNLRVILDFVPNHSSNKHPWFIKSEQRQDPYTDFYIWQDTAPNNWHSVFGGSTWAWSDVRKQYYYHAFLPEQPDLNYRNPAVRDEMKNAVDFWGRMGIDGLRVDAIPYLFESTDVSLNEPQSNLPGFTSEQWEYYEHLYTANLPEINDAIREWSDVLRKYDNSDDDTDNSKFMVVEIYAVPSIRNAYYTNGADMPFNMDLVEGSYPSCNASCIKKLVETEYNTLPEGKWPNFVMGNHDRSRLTSKRGITISGKTYTNVLNMLLLTLRGTPTCYYGDELGMADVDTISFKDTQDPYGKHFGESAYKNFSRDPERTPMQWDSGPQAGFTNSSHPWLPLNQNHTFINVQYEKNATHITPLKVYRALATLRQEPAFLYGSFDFRYTDDNVISYVRSASGYSSYLVVINVGTETGTIDFKTPYDYHEGTVKVSTGNFDHEDYTLDSTIKLDKIILQPAEGLVILLP